MSIVAIHGPVMYITTVAASQHIHVTTLGDSELEFKSLVTAAVPDSYEWDFGDGTQVTDGRVVRHTYAAPGTFVVTMSVETPQGPVTDQVEVTVDGNGHRAEIKTLLEAEDEESAA